jgi:copper(I)-binding protein
MRALNLSLCRTLLQSLSPALLIAALLATSAQAEETPHLHNSPPNSHLNSQPNNRLNSQAAVTEAYIHLPLPGKSTTAGYFTITNSSKQAVVLTGVETDIAARAELHSHTHDQGVMRMRKESEIVIAAQATLAFAPGSWHVMLFDVQSGLTSGDSLQLTLRFADNSVLPVVARIRSLFDQHHH